MCPNSEFRERIDTLDLIINVLKEHEKVLDKLAERLEGIVDELKTRETDGKEVRNTLLQIENKISSLSDALSHLSNKLTPPERIASVRCNEWKDFKAKSRGARRVAFSIDEKAFTVDSLSDGEVFNYSEVLIEHEFHVKTEENRYLVEKILVNGLEDMPLFFKKQLRCGLEVSVRSSKLTLSEDKCVFKASYHIDSDYAKHWLSKELEVPEKDVIEGRISF